MFPFFRVVISLAMILQLGAGSVQIVRASLTPQDCSLPDAERTDADCDHDSASAPLAPAQKTCCCGNNAPCCMNAKVAVKEVSVLVSKTSVRVAALAPAKVHLSSETATRPMCAVNRDVKLIDPGPLYMQKSAFLI